MKMHLKRKIDFGQTVTKMCSYNFADSNTIGLKAFNRLAERLKCKHCLREMNRKWKSTLI